MGAISVGKYRVGKMQFVAHIEDPHRFILHGQGTQVARLALSTGRLRHLVSGHDTGVIHALVQLGIIGEQIPLSSSEEAPSKQNGAYVATYEEIEAAKTLRGGYSGASFKRWGLPATPATGWKIRLAGPVNNLRLNADGTQIAKYEILDKEYLGLPSETPAIVAIEDDSWVAYVRSVTSDSVNVIAVKLDLGTERITSWSRRTEKPDANLTIRFARAYEVNPIDALLAAGHIAPDDLEAQADDYGPMGFMR